MSTYQVALSYAGEQRAYVERVASALQARRVPLFYDRFEAVTLWGKDGIEFFHKLFSVDTSYVVMFISKEYVEKSWPRHERRSAFSKAINEQGEYVLPVRFDDTEIPGLPSTVQYLRATDYEPEALASVIVRKMDMNVLSAKASSIPPPHSKSLSGDVSFDYSAWNGLYIIGDGEYLFETAWSKASDKSIHVVNDPKSIHGLAIAKGAKEIWHATLRSAISPLAFAPRKLVKSSYGAMSTASMPPQRSSKFKTIAGGLPATCYGSYMPFSPTGRRRSKLSR